MIHYVLLVQDILEGSLAEISTQEGLILYTASDKIWNVFRDYFPIV